MTNTTVDAIVPLSLLEAVRALDRVSSQVMTEFAEEMKSKRLGANPTVAAQIDRYAGVVERRGHIPRDEVVQLLRLVGRRSDAGRAFSEAGRLAARRSLQRISPAVRLVHRYTPVGRQRIGAAAARRVAERVFACALDHESSSAVSAVSQGPSVEATPEGSACSFYAAALAELLRLLTDFDGAMVHDACRARGHDVCHWQSTANSGGSHE